MTSTQMEIFKRVQSGDLEGIREQLERLGETGTPDVLGLKDEGGRSVLLIACMLGRSDIARELVRYGAPVEEHTARGYSSLHLAACWGHLDTVRTLLELGADTQARTFRGERPVELARRYSKTDCVDCLVLAEAKQDLMSYVAFVQDLISDPEKKLTMEEKNICTRACTARSDWLQKATHCTAPDLVAQRKDLEATLQPILSKLPAPC